MQKYYSDGYVDIYNGHVLDVLRSLPENSIQLVMTSPPYHGLRNNAGSESVWGGEADCKHDFSAEINIPSRHKDGEIADKASYLVDASAYCQDAGQYCVLCKAWRGQLGLEPTWNLYVDHLVEISREIWRVLKPEGSFFLNLGDTFAGSWGHYAHGKNPGLHKHQNYPIDTPPPTSRVGYDKVTRPKQKMLIPYRAAIALQEDGWILRDELTWFKRNSLPSSVKDRFSCTTERIFRFVKSDKTILWRNEDTKEWRDTEPTRDEKYPRGGRYYNEITGEHSWDKPTDMDEWVHLTPVWHGFDYYFELDAVRESYSNSTIERVSQSTVFDQLGGIKQDLLRGNPEHGNASRCNKMVQNVAFNLRVRDVSRGKGGVYAQGGKAAELTASEDEVKRYQYPEKQEWIRPSRQNAPDRHHGSGPTQSADSKYTSPDANARRLAKTRDKLRSEAKVNAETLFPDDLERQQEYTSLAHNSEGHPNGKNPGDMWSVTTSPFKGAHFAVFPEQLCLKPILSCSRPGDIILDPFGGSGTSAVVAKKLGRKAILIDVIESYCEIARKRVEGITLPMEV